MDNTRWIVLLCASLLAGACHTAQDAPKTPANTILMGGSKSVTRFFVTSVGIGKGGDLGGLAGADAHCQALAHAQYSGDHIWRAYLSASATATTPAVNARDRIGKGPWYNAEGTRVARDLADLHSLAANIGKDTALTELAGPVGDGDEGPVPHQILTGSRPDGTAFPRAPDLTCNNWTSSGAGSARFGLSDRKGPGDATSWNSAGATKACSQDALKTSGGAGLIYCFAAD